MRAAAHGLVVRVVTRDWSNGYGRFVVLAHRLAEGGVVYSVYAHLGPGGPVPPEGGTVRAGQPIGVVGRSGRATTDHLHFEVRRALDPGARWEKAPVLDPLAFLAARVPRPPAAGWPEPYLGWADAAGLVAADAGGDRALARAAWWRMVAGGARLDLDAPPADPAALGAALAAAGALADGAGDPGAALSWAELAADLARVRELGVRLPPVPASPEAHREACERELDAREPGRHPGRLERRRGAPTVAQALLALADLAGASGP